MEIFSIVALAVAALCLTVAVLQFLAARKWQQRYYANRDETTALRAQQTTTDQRLAELRDERDLAGQQFNIAQSATHKAEKERDLALQELEAQKAANANWQKTREEFEKSARASVMAAGAELSNKLLADHKREAGEARETYLKEKAQADKQTRDHLQTVMSSFAQLQKQGDEVRQQSQTLWNTFTSPGATGRLAEVGLENLLKNMGLESGRDYLPQHTIQRGERSGSRPDCIIRLPNNRMVVIDCKASKHLLAMAEAEDALGEAAAQQQFFDTMNRHLKALTEKDYVAALQQESWFDGLDSRKATMTMVMYLPSTSALERMRKEDRAFFDKAEKARVLLLCPATLHAMLSLVSREISDERKLENQEKIIGEVEQLLRGLGHVFGHLSTVGKNLKSLSSSFASFSSSYNRYLPTRLRNLEKYGVQVPDNKKLPKQMDRHELRDLSDLVDLEPDADDIPSLEDYRQERA